MELSFPIYILRLGKERRIVFPQDLADIGHAEFWEKTVSFVVAEHYKIAQKPLANLPYSQSRARVVGNIVYYGGKPDADLLEAIRQVLGNRELAFRFDGHEKRLREDVLAFRRLIRAGS